LNNGIFETVCSFSNRYGGYILLGIEDNGNVIGVNRKAVAEMKKNFVNMLNNPQKITPTLFLNLEEIETDGKLVLYVYVPVSSQVELCSDKVYDRIEEADVDITKSTDMEILKSAGLYDEDWRSGKRGFNLAAVLLFGRDDVIRSCAPGYVTDAILRKENLDRYDDRLMVDTNLIESYDLLMDFIAKHTSDRFFLIDDQRVSVRTWIAREIVSNILVHRKYSSPFPAKIIIENDRIYTENWNKAMRHGHINRHINPDNFTPYPKNPLLARFFVNIGRADKLGSGVRNLYKYTKIYSGGKPEVIEGDIFKTIVPLSLDSVEMSDKMSDKNESAEKRVLRIIMPHFSNHEWIDAATVRRYLKKLIELNILEASGTNRNRKYRLIK